MLPSLHLEPHQKTMDKPTKDRLLKILKGTTLTIISVKGQVICHLTPLSELQKEILKRVGLDDVVDQQLKIHKTLT